MEEQQVKDLDIKHKLFVEEYLANGMNGRQAYKTIYELEDDDAADSCASRLLSNARVREFLEERQEALQIKMGVRKQDLVKDLLEIKTRCMQNIKIKLDQDGNPVLDKNGNIICVFDAKNSISSISQLSKMLGFDAPVRSEVELSDKRSIKKSIEGIKNAIEQAKDSPEVTV